MAQEVQGLCTELSLEPSDLSIRVKPRPNSRERHSQRLGEARAVGTGLSLRRPSQCPGWSLMSNLASGKVLNLNCARL